MVVTKIGHSAVWQSSSIPVSPRVDIWWSMSRPIRPAWFRTLWRSWRKIWSALSAQTILLDALRTASEQAYLSTPEWQARERAADQAIAEGRVRTFDTMDEMLDFLNPIKYRSVEPSGPLDAGSHSRSKRNGRGLRLFQQGAGQPPFHPSLRIRKMEGHPGIWEGHVTLDYVFTFHVENDPATGETVFVFRNIGTYDSTENHDLVAPYASLPSTILISSSVNP